VVWLALKRYPLVNAKRADLDCGDIFIQIGLVGSMEPNLKEVVRNFDFYHHASLLSSDDPVDGNSLLIRNLFQSCYTWRSSGY
jgi:hypothetical protein